MFKTTGSERENAAARQYLAEAGYLVLDGEVSVSTAYGCVFRGDPATRTDGIRPPIPI